METVLLVEDEVAVRVVLRCLLERQGYSVLEAGESGQALEIAARYPASIHLLITDVVLPRTRCEGWVARLKRRRPGLKVIYISGYPEEVISRFGLSDSDTNFLRKPFTPEALVLKVREVLDSRGTLHTPLQSEAAEAS